jgi:CTP synthase
MQMSVIEYARNVLKLSHAHSTEMDAGTQDPVIDLMEGQKSVTSKGGTMRLGAYPCKIQNGTLAYEVYGTEFISERHRHRWELNNKYLDALQQAGLKASGTNPETNLVEIVEIPGHPFFIGVQYHPELKSTVENPHPLFVHFVKAAKAFAARKDSLAGESLPNELV